MEEENHIGVLYCQHGEFRLSKDFLYILRINNLPNYDTYSDEIKDRTNEKMIDIFLENADNRNVARSRDGSVLSVKYLYYPKFITNKQLVIDCININYGGSSENPEINYDKILRKLIQFDYFKTIDEIKTFIKYLQR